MPAALVGRLIAVVGIVAAFLGIWLDVVSARGFGTSYWNVPGILGEVLLASACLAAVAALAGLTLRRPAFDLLLGATGAGLFGLYLFIPAGSAFSAWDTLAIGAWLGVCCGLVVIGAAVALSAWGAEIWPPYLAIAAVAAGGWILVMVGIWFGVDNQGGGSYWNPEGSGRGLGVLFLILLGVWAFAAAVSLLTSTPAAPLLTVAAALIVLGVALVVPLLSVLSDLDTLRTGAWLPLGGGVLLSVGSALALRGLPSPAPLGEGDAAGS